jgi:hypothetical protein
MDFFKGWHRPTVCTTIVAVVVLLIVYHFAIARRHRHE